MKLLICMLLICGAGVCGAGVVRIDGTWWRGIQELGKFTYIQGYFDAVSQEASNEQTTIILSSIAAPKECQKSFDKLSDLTGKGPAEMFGHVSIGQLSEGLDRFYADYRNRLILVPHAILMVMNSINGLSEADNEKAIEYWRKQDNTTQ